MAVDFRVSGLDEAVRRISEVEKGLDTEELSRWAIKIESDAKRKAGRSQAMVKITVEPMETNSHDLQFSYTPDTVRFLLEAMHENLSSMPSTTKLFFGEALKELERHRSYG